MRTPPSRLLLLAQLLACAASVSAQPYDAALPPSLRVCVQAYLPFVMSATAAGRSLQDAVLVSNSLPGFSTTAGLPGKLVYEGVNSTQLDGFDVAFARLMLKDMLGLAIIWVPYPDTSAMYVGLVDGDCDLLMSGAELDPRRAACPETCPGSLPVLSDQSDYALGSLNYSGRLQQVCCLEYSVPYLFTGGFAILSLAAAAPNSPLAAILSVEVLNAATPVLIAIVGYGFVMYLLERRRSPAFRRPSDGVYFAFISTATFGYGDLSPASSLGRALTCFWAILAVLSLTTFTGVVSSMLTVAALQFRAVTSLDQVTPSQLCVERSYRTASIFVAEAMGLPIVGASGDVGGGVIVAQPTECVQMVANGSVLAFMTDSSVLSYMAYGFSEAPAFYISPVLRPNPMAWAFRRGSPLLGPLNAALIETLVNSTWRSPKVALKNSWFPTGAPTPISVIPGLNAPTFTAACVLMGLWLLCLLAEKLFDSPRVQQAIARLRPAPPAAEQPPKAAQSREGALHAAVAAARAAASAAAEAAERAEALLSLAPAEAGGLRRRIGEIEL